MGTSSSEALHVTIPRWGARRPSTGDWRFRTALLQLPLSGGPGGREVYKINIGVTCLSLAGEAGAGPLHPATTFGPFLGRGGSTCHLWGETPLPASVPASASWALTLGPL